MGHPLINRAMTPVAVGVEYVSKTHERPKSTVAISIGRCQSFGKVEQSNNKKVVKSAIRWAAASTATGICFTGLVACDQ